LSSSTRPKRSLGQNFLIDRGAAARIVAELSPGPHDAVLEIGPGRGALTAALIQAAGRVAAVELDHELARRLSERFSEDGLVVLERDILEIRLEHVLAALDRPTSDRLVVAGNLPYNISKPVAMKLVLEHARTDRAVLMFQREVAQRLTSRPGSRSYGPLTVLVGEVYEVRRVFDLPGSAFRPRPRVVSTVTAWRRRGEAAVDDEILRRLRVCLGACFARRRKTLRNNLRATLGDEASAELLLLRSDLDGTLRPEAVDPAGFRRLAAAWPA